MLPPHGLEDREVERPERVCQDERPERACKQRSGGCPAHVWTLPEAHNISALERYFSEETLRRENAAILVEACFGARGKKRHGKQTNSVAWRYIQQVGQPLRAGERSRSSIIDMAAGDASQTGRRKRARVSTKRPIELTAESAILSLTINYKHGSLWGRRFAQGLAAQDMPQRFLAHSLAHPCTLR